MSTYRLCKSYDEISDKVQEMPDNTSDLVALTQFLENASSVTVVNLQTAVDEAGERLLFLLDYATLPCMLAIITHKITSGIVILGSNLIFLCL